MSTLSSALSEGQLRGVILRLSLLAAASYLFFVAEDFWFIGGALWNLPVVILSFILYGLAFLMLGMAVFWTVRDWSQWLILGALLFALFAQYYTWILTTSPRDMGTDSALYSIYAADLWISGENPYTQDMAQSFSVYDVSDYYRTPRLDGSTAAGLPYPALHFVAYVPLRLLGVQDIRVLYVAAYAGVLIVLFRFAPTPLRGLALIPLYTNIRYLEYTFGWVSDSVWTFFAVAMVSQWRKPTWRAVLYGLACAYKQLPWFLAPFIIIRLILDQDDADDRRPWSRVLYFAGVSGAVFLLINLPFALADPGAWLDGIFEPLVAPYIYFGSGLSTLTQLDFVPLPRGFYSVVTLVVMVSLLVIYGLRFGQMKHMLWFLPGVVLWFSYRSLQNYFVYWVPLLIVAAIEMMRARHVEAEENLPTGRWGATPITLIAGLAVLIIAGAGFFFSRTQTPLEIHVSELADGQDLEAVDQLEIEVINTSSVEISPRFGVQRPGWQPYPWEIAAGPETLGAGERGIYVVSTSIDYRMFHIGEGAQIIVTDAGGNLQIRGVEKVRWDLLYGPGVPFP